MPSSPGFVLRTAVVVATLFAFEMLCASAQADAPLRVALFKTASDDPSQRALAEAIDPVLLSELGDVPGLEVAARPALDLPSMQLAVDCVGETAECLTLAAKQAQADGLVAPMVRKVGSEVVVTLLLHDARKQIAITAATRRFSGQQVDQDVLDAISGMVRELFGVAPAQTAAAAPLDTQVAPEPEAPLDSTQGPPPTAAKPLPIVPIVLGAVGVVLIGAGTGFGLAAKSSEDEYAKLKIGRDDTAAAKRAEDKYDSAATSALLSNVSFGLGGAAVAAAIVLLIVDMSANHEAAPTSARLSVSSQLGRLALTGAWD